MADPRSVLLLDSDRPRRAGAAALLATLDRIATPAETLEEALAAAAGQDIAIVLVDGLDADGRALTAAIRAGVAGSPTLPILAWTLACAGADAVIDTLDTLAVLVERFRPDDRAAQTRLAGLLGAATFADLERRFALQLADALAALDRNDPDLSAILHRAGGLAGTLGHAAVADPFLSLSEGDESRRGAVRIAVRRALHAIALDQRRASRSAPPSPAG